MAAVANDQKGKHDAVLDFLVDKHGHDGERVMDTVVDLLHRRGLLSTDEFGVGPSGTRALTERRHVDVFRRYCAGALDPQPGAGVAREERAEALAAAAPAAPPPAPAVLSPDLLALPVSVTPSAAKALEKALAEAAAKASAASTGGAAEEIKGGTPCKRSGCDLTYAGPQSLCQECVYHPGQPVFHEGYKYWSCCPSSKTTEFQDFLGFVGCQRATCVFVDDEAALMKKAKCRHDFYQVGSTINMSIYAKKAVPAKCSFQCSAHQLRVSLTYDAGKKFYSMDVALAGPVDAGRCRVEIMGPKVELTLVKADGSTWQDLGTVTEGSDMPGVGA